MPDVEPTSPLDDLVAAGIVAEASEDGDPLDIDPAPHRSATTRRARS
jgi:hypothetical protein